jgi:hypothetical protein
MIILKYGVNSMITVTAKLIKITSALISTLITTMPI